MVVVQRLSCPEACGIFLDQGSKLYRCIGRRILKHWTTREVLISFLGCLLLVYIHINDFSVLILYPATLINLFNYSTSFF